MAKKPRKQFSYGNELAVESIDDVEEKPTTITNLLDALKQFGTAPVGPVPMDLSDTLLDHLQGQYCAIILPYAHRQLLNDAISRANDNDGKFWILYSEDIVKEACTYGVTNSDGELLFNTATGRKILAALHPKISRIFWRSVMALNGYFPETNKTLVKNSSGTENSNGSSDSVLSSDVPGQNSPDDSDPTPEKSTNSGGLSTL